MSLLPFVQWLNDTPWSVFLRENDYSFTLIETVHVLGLSCSVGLIMWVDLRLMGLAMTREKASDVLAELEPWATGGFAVMIVSGLLLLLSEPLKCYMATSFRLKVVMLVLAGLNVWYFHARVCPKMREWDRPHVSTWNARMVGALSMALWLAIIVAGRWTAYK